MNPQRIRPLPPLAEWRAEGEAYTHRGQSVFVVHSRGSGARPPLLCIHGFPSSSWDYAGLWPALAEGYSALVTADLLGFGFSAKPLAYDYSLMDQTDLLCGLLAQLGYGEVHVLAHDYGVSIAQELLARDLAGNAPRLRSVTLLNGGLFPETHRPTLGQKLLRSPLGPWFAQRMNPRRFARSFRAVWGPATPPSPAELQAYWELIEENQGRRVMPRLIGYIEERRRHRARWVGALENTSVPLRLINGPEDPVSGAHMAARYRELVPGADVVSLPGIGHYPQVEAPAAVLDALRQFVEQR